MSGGRSDRNIQLRRKIYPECEVVKIFQRLTHTSEWARDINGKWPRAFDSERCKHSLDHHRAIERRSQ